MESMNLKDFKNDPINFPESAAQGSLGSSDFHQEMNTLKIEKLSNRITIISVIIPCLIFAILVFAYLDIKERVVDVDMTKKLQVKKVAQQLEEKFNALDVRIAKIKFDFDKKLPLLTKKEEALENQVAKMATSKADLKTIEAAMANLNKKIQSNLGKNKSNLVAMEAINKELLASIKENNILFKEKTGLLKKDITLFKKKTGLLKKDITLFKETFDARILELLALEEQIGNLGKTTSLLDKKLKRLEQDKISIKELDKQVDLVRLPLEKKIQDLDIRLNQQKLSKLPPVKTTGKGLEKKKSKIKPVPQLDTGNIKSENISEGTLTQ